MKRTPVGSCPPACSRRGRLASLDCVGVLQALFLAPFRIVSVLWSFGVRTAFGFFNGLFMGFMGLFGLGMIAMVAFAIFRALPVLPSSLSGRGGA